VQIERPPGVFPKRTVENLPEHSSFAGKIPENFETVPGGFPGGIQENNSFKMLSIELPQSDIQKLLSQGGGGGEVPGAMKKGHLAPAFPEKPCSYTILGIQGYLGSPEGRSQKIRRHTLAEHEGRAFLRGTCGCSVCQLLGFGSFGGAHPPRPRRGYLLRYGLAEGVAAVFTKGNFQILFFLFYPEKGDHPSRKKKPLGMSRHGTFSGDKVKGLQRENPPGKKKAKLHPCSFIGDGDFYLRKLLSFPLGKKEGVHLFRSQGESKGSLSIQAPGQRCLLHSALQEGKEFTH
jgi:hypothetical protein